MSIDITVAVARGEGPTVIAAFDDSLRKVGLSSFNLIRLSSMIPPGTIVKPGARGSVQGAWGDRLYAVWSFQSAELLGQEAWAGLGWLQEPDRGRGSVR